MSADGDFYVGYEPRMPAGLARVLRGRVTALLAGVALVALGLAAAAPRADGGRWEYGVVRAWEGRVVEAPYPMLAVPAPDGGGWRYVPLVAKGKRGAGGLVTGLDGRAVRARGSLVAREGGELVELEARPEPLEHATLPMLDTLVPVGTREVVGEIVDGKCHLGVMVPGDGRVHRGCAIRCISGGAPPLLVARDAAGRAQRFLLTDAAGAAVGARVLPLVAEPVRVRGRVLRRGDLLFLAADPSTYERLP